MRVWLPYVAAGSGTDIFTSSFAEHLEMKGHQPVVQRFPHWLQYAPQLLRFASPPAAADVTLTNSWNGFAFAREEVPMVTMEQLCVHDPAYWEFRSRPQALFHDQLVKEFERRTFDKADLIVAVSESTRAAVQAAFRNVDPEVIPNGVDVSFFTPARDSMPSAGSPFRLLFVGNLTHRKGADLLPQVMTLLGREFELHYTSGLRASAKLELENAVALGSLGRSEVRDAYRNADALLFPTRLEGMPISVLEAMACGLPVIGSNRSSMPEAVEDGVTGILCPLEPSAFAQAARALQADRKLMAGMAVAARSKVEQSFSMSAVVDRYIRAFERVLEP